MLIEAITQLKLCACFSPIKLGIQTESLWPGETMSPEESPKFMAFMKSVIKNSELKRFGKI